MCSGFFGTTISWLIKFNVREEINFFFYTTKQYSNYERFLKMKKRKIRWGWIIFAVVVVAGGAYLYFSGQQAVQNATADYETVEITKGDLTATIGATGSVHAEQTAYVVWETGGNVEDIFVSVGDDVAKGDDLASLELVSMNQSVILAEADLLSAENALDALYENYSDLAVSQKQQEIAGLEDQIADLKNKVTGQIYPASQAYIDQAEANLFLAKDQLDDAKEDFEPYENKQDTVIRATLQARVSELQQLYDSRLRQYNYMTGDANPLDLAVAETNLALAEAQLIEAQKDMADLLAGVPEGDVSAAEARVVAAEATVAMRFADSPIAGVVTSVENKVGDQVNAGSVAFRVDDLDALLVDVMISEVDINQVSVGQEVFLNFDAILNKTYAGVVKEVALVGESANGAVNFLVSVEVTDADDAIKPGMTAAVDVVIGSVEGVLLVPNRAVRVVDGNRVVYVLGSAGALEMVDVELGASANSFSELVSGDLKNGDVVVLNPPAEFSPIMMGGGPGF